MRLTKVKTLVITTCVKEKRKGHHKAKDLYVSDLFKKMRNYAEMYNYDWRIISAKHGLIDPEEIIMNDDKSISIFRIFQETMTNVVRHSRATKVKVSLIESGVWFRTPGGEKA